MNSCWMQEDGQMGQMKKPQNVACKSWKTNSPVVELVAPSCVIQQACACHIYNGLPSMYQ